MTERRREHMGSWDSLFQTLPPTIPSPRLCERVLDGIRREQARQARVRFAASMAASAASFAGMLYAGQLFAAAADGTGFSAYASLAFSDGRTLLSSAQSFGASLLESLPGPEATLMLAVLAALLQSVRAALSTGARWQIARRALAA